MSHANQQHSLVEPGGRPFSGRLPRPRRRDARIFRLPRQSLIRYRNHNLVSSFIHRPAFFSALFDLQFYLLLFFFSGTTAPEDWRELRNNKCETHSQELTELHLADWVSLKMQRREERQT